MAKFPFSFDSSYNNFVSELNMRFTDELSFTDQHCRDYEDLSEIFLIWQDRQKQEVVFESLPNVQVGATEAVRKLTQLLRRKYKLKIRFQ